MGWHKEFESNRQTRVTLHQGDVAAAESWGTHTRVWLKGESQGPTFTLRVRYREFVDWWLDGARPGG